MNTVSIYFHLFSKTYYFYLSLSSTYITKLIRTNPIGRKHFQMDCLSSTILSVTGYFWPSTRNDRCVMATTSKLSLSILI